jgi:hypothetical protein
VGRSAHWAITTFLTSSCGSCIRACNGRVYPSSAVSKTRNQLSRIGTDSRSCPLTRWCNGGILPGFWGWAIIRSQEGHDPFVRFVLESCDNRAVPPPERPRAALSTREPGHAGRRDHGETAVCARRLPPCLPSPATRFSQHGNMDRMNATDAPCSMPYLSSAVRVVGERAGAHALFRALRGLYLMGSTRKIQGGMHYQ